MRANSEAYDKIGSSDHNTRTQEQLANEWRIC